MIKINPFLSLGKSSGRVQANLRKFMGRSPRACRDDEGTIRYHDDFIALGETTNFVRYHKLQYA